MKLRYLKAKQWLLIALLGLMGLSSCSKEDDNDLPTLMYGPPTKAYNVVE